MEKYLNKLFDYQKFENNKKLEALIKETESRYAEAINDEDLELIAAAGDNVPMNGDPFSQEIIKQEEITF